MKALLGLIVLICLIVLLISGTAFAAALWLYFFNDFTDLLTSL